MSLSQLSGSLKIFKHKNAIFLEIKKYFFTSVCPEFHAHAFKLSFYMELLISFCFALIKANKHTQTLNPSPAFEEINV